MSTKSITSVLFVIAMLVVACGGATPKPIAEFTAISTTEPVAQATPLIEATAQPTATSTAQSADATAVSCEDVDSHFPNPSVWGRGYERFEVGNSFPDCAWWITLWPLGAADTTATQNMFAYTRSGQWIFSDPQPPFVHTDASLVRFSAISLYCCAYFDFYDLRTSELIRVQMDGTTVTYKTELVAPEDILPELGPDNECNWPTRYDLILDLIEKDPSVRVKSVDRWESADGCRISWTQMFVENPAATILVVANDGQLTTVRREGEFLFWAPERLNDEYAFIYTGGSVISLNPASNTITDEPANFDLLLETYSLTDQESGVVLYLRFADPESINQIRSMVHVSGHTGWQKVAGTTSVAGLQYQVEGKWQTAIIFLRDGSYYGPAVFGNVREHRYWSIDEGGNPTSSFADGSVNTFVLGDDGTVTYTTK